MTSREVRISDFVRSRPMAVILAVAAAVMMLQWPDLSGSHYPAAAHGLMFTAPSQWLPDHPSLSLKLNLVCLIAIGALMTQLNVAFNILRSYSVTFVGLFFVMTAATPAVACRFQGASLMALTVLLACGAMLSVYAAPALSRRVYAAFLLIASGTLVEYGFTVYIPVMFAGLVQMRAASARTVIAALLGCATPLWLVAAFAPWPIPWLKMPDFTNPFSQWPVMETVRFWSTVGVTLATGTVLGAVNLVRIFGYNARARSVNGLLTLVSVATAAFCLIDFTNAGTYVVLLNACVAFQAGHFLTINIRRRSYLLMLFLPAVYIGLYVWGAIAR